MMGRQPKSQQKLFYTTFNLDQRVRKEHILRKIATHVNFDYIYKEVEGTYGSKGNVSVPPPVILKMMLLLILYNVVFFLGAYLAFLRYDVRWSGGETS